MSPSHGAESGVLDAAEAQGGPEGHFLRGFERQAERLGLQVPPVPVPPVPQHVAPRVPRARPMGIPVTGAALQAMGIPWMPPKRPGGVSTPLDQQHKDWNSDDEEIDEFGRKKRRKKGQAEAERGKDALFEMVSGCVYRCVCSLLYDYMVL